MSKDTTQNANSTTMATNIGVLTNDLTRLDVLLAKTELSEEEDVDVVELLKRLENAEGMAGEVEAKVDDILAKLEGILQEMNEQEKAEIESGAETPKAKAD